KVLTTSPTTSPGTISTHTIMITSVKARANKSIITSGDIGLSETRRQAADNQCPAIDQHKQHDLERQRNNDRRQHHHAHCHQHAGNHEIDDEEWNKQHEADLKSSFQFAGDECRRQYEKRNLL